MEGLRISRLLPEQTEEYIHFFDTTDHDDNVDEHKCYCVCWSNDNCSGKDFSKVENRRAYAEQYVRNGNVQGYFAYHGEEIVGWCNANTKADCLNCESWRRFMDYVATDDLESGQRVKSVFCFVIAPDMRGKGIATQLLMRVCEDAASDGFDVIEAYPYRNADMLSAFCGYEEMYRKCGFEVFYEQGQRLVMRKELRKKDERVMVKK